MAKEEILTHRKFLHLVRELALPPVRVLGHLEHMFLTCHVQANPVFATRDQLEAAAGWDGKRGLFSSKTMLVGFVDAKLDGTYEVHDYWEHCPRYVRQRRDYKTEGSRADSRETARNGAGSRLPITDPSSRSELQHRSRGGAAKGGEEDRDRTVIPFRGRGAGDAAAGGEETLISAYLGKVAAQMLTGGAPKVRGRRRPAFEQMTETQLADHCARAETKHSKVKAQELWRHRVSELAMHRGGVELLRKACAYVWLSRNGGTQSVGQYIGNPAGYLNTVTSNFIKDQRKGKAQ